ncbi:hypothetical protein JXC34_00730 [Candidatus Woesearchaeota archaeon]|nr:hypothetical protein [Candidatus Woesearchaeota archaeon]
MDNVDYSPLVEEIQKVADSLTELNGTVIKKHLWPLLELSLETDFYWDISSLYDRVRPDSNWAYVQKQLEGIAGQYST